jgi:hypothetical protein
VVSDLGWEGYLSVGFVRERESFEECGAGGGFGSIRVTVGLARWIGIRREGCGVGCWHGSVTWRGARGNVGRLGIAEESRGFCAGSTATWAGLDQMNVNKTSSWTDTTGPAGARGLVAGNMSGGVLERDSGFTDLRCLGMGR